MASNKYIAQQANKTGDNTAQLGRKGINFSTLPTLIKETFEIWDCRIKYSTQQEGSVFVVGHPIYSKMGPSTLSGAMPIGLNTTERTETYVYNSHNLFTEYFDNTRFISTGSSTGSHYTTTIADSLTGSALAYWNFDSVNEITDSTGNNYTGSLFDTTYTSDGKINYAREFNGTTSRINFSKIIQLNQDLTVSLWFKTTSTDTAYLFSITDSSLSDALRIRALSTGKVTANVRANGEPTVEVTTVGTYNEGNWHNVVVTWDNTNEIFTMMIDGGVETLTNSTGFTGTFATTLQMVMGYNQIGNNYYFTGTLDEVSVYDKLLTTNEKLLLYTIQKEGNVNGQYPFWTDNSYVLNGSDYLQTEYIAREDKIYKAIKVKIDSEYLDTGLTAYNDLNIIGSLNGSDYTLTHNSLTPITNISTDGIKIKLINTSSTGQEIKINKFDVNYTE